MRGNVFGKMISMTSFGESHGVAMGVVVDGVPAGLPFSLEDLQRELQRRAPGQQDYVSSRYEPDTAEVLSGVFEGETLGTPVAVIVRNIGQNSRAYDEFKDQNLHRPGHGDRTTLAKYKRRDHRGGGRSSGRETVARVIGGYLASLALPRQVCVRAFINRLGPFTLESESPLPREVQDYLLTLKEQGESVGGRIRILVEHCPVGLGEPAFDKLKADFAKALLSIGGCVGFSYGIGEAFLEKMGREVSGEAGHFGGMEGGISNGDTLAMEALFKPPSTVGERALRGRHDPCLLPRALPVVESMVTFVLADHYLRQNAYHGHVHGD